MRFVEFTSHFSYLKNCHDGFTKGGCGTRWSARGNCSIIRAVPARDNSSDSHPPADNIANDELRVEDCSPSENSAAATLESLQMNPDLCKYCRKMCDNWPNPQDPEPHIVEEHHGSEKELQESAKKGCSICSLYLKVPFGRDRLFSINGRSWARKLDSTMTSAGASIESRAPGRALLTRHGYRRDGPYILVLYTPEPSLEGETSHVQGPYYHIRERILFPYRKPELEAILSADATRTTFDGLSTSNLWYKLCETTHQKCRSSVYSTFRPTRLVDLTATKPVLRTSPNFESDCKYATLSHCWGFTQYAVLTGDVLLNYHDEIPEAAISTTFKDAMTVAKYFGYRYIWIDSLCIIQDSEDDWRQESALMSKLYSNSGLNISAAGAKDGSVGCFFAREDNWLEIVSTISRGTRARYIVLDDNFESKLLDNMPLMRRGWALQERILAPRTIHFAKNQLFWECNEFHACESLPDGYQHEGSITRLGDDTPASEDLSVWQAIVLSYSFGELTDSKDKLVAISGLAQAVQSDLLGSYVAGLWRNGIESQLPWYMYGGHKHRPDDYRAPTWSWASVDGPISVSNRKPEQVFIRVHDVVIENATEGNIYGQIVSGSLSLTCKILLFGEVINFEHEISENMSGILITLRMDGGEFHAVFWPDSIQDEIPKDGVAAYVYVVPMILDKCYGLQGIFITPTGLVPGQYRRIGYFRSIDLPSDSDSDFNSDSALDHDLKGFREIILAEKLNVSDDAYARIITDEDGKLQRIIDIV
ncbi:heterokaryon incompatibility protein-domain-containing protein [Cadophora sp. MPI-SDFR-AT-0126]|nr:heterokaryon incompatibility protein-domain-containing protein [Leotiomycetes sp. MPI-SDFR-AT-0126]